MVGNPLTVLVAVDEAHRRDRIVQWFGPEHDLRVAGTGDAARLRLDASVDLAILDRELPGPDGPVVARQRREADVYVVLLEESTGAPEPDTGEIDEHLERPVGPEGLQGVLDVVLTEKVYVTSLERFYALTTKLARLEASRPPEELADNEYYRRLRWLVAEQRAEIDRALAGGSPDWPTAFENCSGDASPSGRVSPSGR